MDTALATQLCGEWSGTTTHSSQDSNQSSAQYGPLYAGPGSKNDKPPFKLHKLSSSEHRKVESAKKYAMEQSINIVLMKQTLAHQQIQIQNAYNSMQKQQAWALMCRIYVGSINFTIPEETVRQTFYPFGPIRTFNLSLDPTTNKHKGYAFIEYEIPEAASLAIEQMNGVFIGGRNIKVGRPNNMPQAQAVIDNYLEESKKYNRIYVAAIHQAISQNDLKTVFEAFGRVTLCDMPKEPSAPSRHRGFAFLEFENTQSAFDAIAAMNLFDLGGQFIRVGKAVTPPNLQPTTMTPTAPLPTATAVAAAAITAKLTALEAAKDIQSPVVIVPTKIVEMRMKAPSIPPPSVVHLPELSLSKNLPSSKSSQSTSSSYIQNTSLNNATINNSFTIKEAFLENKTNPTDYGTNNKISNPKSKIDKFDLHQSSNLNDDNINKGNSNNNKNDNENILHQEINAKEFSEYNSLNQVPINQNQSINKSETRLMLLENATTLDDIDSDLEEEMSEECSKYGKVRGVFVVPEKGGSSAVKIFVRFSECDEARMAITALDGRFFAGRQIKAIFSDDSRFL